MSLRDTLLEAVTKRATPRKVHLPSLGVEVFVRELTVGDHLDLGEVVRSGDTKRLILEIISRTLVDENGARLLSVEELEQLPGSVLMELEQLPEVQAAAEAPDPKGSSKSRKGRSRSG